LNKEKDRLSKVFIDKEALAKKLHYSRNDFNTNTPNSTQQAEE
jgi:hypothetical protein